MRRVLAVVGLVLVFPASAEATTLVDQNGQSAEPYQRWISRAAAPSVRSQITVIPGGCPELASPVVAGCTRADGPIWFTDRASLFHELGHRFDIAMPAGVRNRFRHLTHDKRDWDEGYETIYRDPPRERFAEAYAACANGDWSDEWVWAYGYEPSRRTHRRVCGLICRAGRKQPEQFELPRNRKTRRACRWR